MNTNEICQSDEECVVDGWDGDGLPKAKCKDSEDRCIPLTNLDKGTHFIDYVYQSGEKTSIPDTSVTANYVDGGQCVSSCFTTNEPWDETQDQGALGLPWCWLNSGQTSWGYCFPNGSPSCSFNGGWMRAGKGSLSSCTLRCTNGYEGYTSTPTCLSDESAVVMPSSPESAGCVPIYCNTYNIDSTTSSFQGTGFSDSCAVSNTLQAGMWGWAYLAIRFPFIFSFYTFTSHS